MEHRKRSILKTISWRIFSFILTMCIIFAYTRNLKQAVCVGAGIDAVKMFLYYIHERIWNRVRFGRIKTPEYQI